MSRVIAVLPAYNAEKTLEKTLRDLPPGTVDEVILVDDASRDGTVETARKLGLTVIRHEKNRGYGGNQKTCYAEALKRSPDVVVMIHPDYQYDARVAAVMVRFIELGICDVMFGSRIRTRAEALAGGMPLYKYLANRALTMAENLVLGTNLGETHSGFRAYGRRVLETVPWERNSDDFVFDQQFIVQARHFGFRMGDVPVPTRYERESSSINFRRSVVYGLGTLWTLFRWTLHRLGILSCRLFEPR
jgi:glycosyltransferase involved in cell wall biosynthesis